MEARVKTRGRGLLPPEMSQIVRGRTDDQVVEYLKEHHSISVTRNAIVMWRKRRGEERVLPRYDDLLPWSVKVEHAYMYIPKLLRFEARKRRGLPLDPRDERRLQVFKDKLAAENAVVHYDADTEQGWWTVPRREGIDTDIIRDPKRS